MILYLHLLFMIHFTLETIILPKPARLPHPHFHSLQSVSGISLIVRRILNRHETFWKNSIFFIFLFLPRLKTVRTEGIPDADYISLCRSLVYWHKLLVSCHRSRSATQLSLNGNIIESARFYDYYWKVIIQILGTLHLQNGKKKKKVKKEILNHFVGTYWFCILLQIP